MYTTGHGGVSAIMDFDSARRLKRSTAIPTLMALNDVRGGSGMGYATVYVAVM